MFDEWPGKVFVDSNRVVSMFLISKKLDYALRALTFLAEKDSDEVILAREIAKEQKIPIRFLQKIMRQLVDKGYVRSFHGPGGGYALAKQPDEISLKQIMEAVEGPICLLECVDSDPGCGIYDRCTQIPVWQNLHDQFLTMLSEKKLTHLSGQDMQNCSKSALPLS